MNTSPRKLRHFGAPLLIVLLAATSGAYPSAMRIFRKQADRIGADRPRVAMGFMSFAGTATTAVGPVLGGVSDRILRVALDLHGEPSPLAAYHPPRSSVGSQR